MRHLLDILKTDLGCNKEEKSVGKPATFGFQQNEPAEYLQHPGDTPRWSKLATKSEDILKAIDFLAHEQAEPEYSVCNDTSPNMEGKDEFSEDLSKLVPVGPDPLSLVESAETPDNSAPTLSSTACDADFETSESLREVDNLQDSFAESFHISTDNAQQ